ESARSAAPTRAPATRRRPRAPAAPAAGPRGCASSGSASSSLRSRPAYGSSGLPVVTRGALVGAQPSQHAAIVVHRIVALWRLDNLNHRREAQVAHDLAERFGPDGPLADPLMAIHPGPRRDIGLVEMQALEQIQPDRAVEWIPHAPEPGGHVIPRGVQMRRAKAERH